MIQATHDNEPAKTDPIPPPVGLAAVWKHIKNWLELYLWVPLSLLFIWGFAWFAYFLTGRRPQENVDWIVGLAGNFVKSVMLILLVSIFRQQCGLWLNREEQKDNPTLVWAQNILTIAAICVFGYILEH